MNAYRVGDSWDCKSGFRKSGGKCLRVIQNQQSSNNKHSYSLLSWFFNDNKPTLLFWLTGVFVIYLARSKSSSKARRKKIVITNDTPRVYPPKPPKPVIPPKPPKPVIPPKPPKPVIPPKPPKPVIPPKPPKPVIPPKPPKPVIPPKPPKPVIPPKPPKPVIPPKPPKPVIPPKPPSIIQKEKIGFGFEVLDFEQGSKEWLEWRHSGIGASDASTVMGANQFQSPDELLYQKKNKINTEPNAKMRKGTKLEPKARELYIEFTGIEVTPLCLEDKEDPWIIASMDGISSDYGHIVEIKCGESAYWQLSRGIVPDYYYAQLQHQMMITGLNEVDYWCYWPGYEPKLKTVSRDQSYINLLYKAEKRIYREARVIEDQYL